MEFGFFDHPIADDQTLGDYYARVCDHRAIIGSLLCYHVREHQPTPLGMAPARAGFLARVAQRTRRLRFGPLVYALPLYHPLPHHRDICILLPISERRAARVSASGPAAPQPKRADRDS